MPQGVGIGVIVPFKDANLRPDGRARNRLINGATRSRGAGERAAEGEVGRLAAGHARPVRLTAITAAALVLLNLDRPATQ